MLFEYRLEIEGVWRARYQIYDYSVELQKRRTDKPGNFGRKKPGKWHMPFSFDVPNGVAVWNQGVVATACQRTIIPGFKTAEDAIDVGMVIWDSYKTYVLDDKNKPLIQHITLEV